MSIDIAIRRGEERPCVRCLGDLFESDHCEKCHRTGYFAEEPNGKENTIRVAVIYEGEVSARGLKKIKRAPKSYEVREWLPCCEMSRMWCLFEKKRRHSSQTFIEVRVGPTVDQKEDYGSSKTYPTLRVSSVMLKFCPSCGCPVRIEIVEKLADIVRRKREVTEVDVETKREKIP